MERQRQEINNMVQVLQRLVQKYGKRIINTMKRLIRWIINWLYAEEITALVQEAVDDEFEAT